MEIFLLLLDELDDAAAVLRVWCWRLSGFFLACGLFTVTIVTAMRWPLLAAMTLFVAVVWGGLSSLGTRPLSRFRTDP